MWIQWHYFSNLNQKVNYPKMTFDPTSVEVTCVTLPKDHFIQFPWKYVKVSGYSDVFSKTWTKGHGPLDDLWPQVCWGHMCDATQGSLCPSPIGIHQCMWIQWSILQNSTPLYIHTTYILHTTYTMSDHIVSFWTKFRRDKNSKGAVIWASGLAQLLFPCLSPMRPGFDFQSGQMSRMWIWFSVHTCPRRFSPSTSVFSCI